MRKIRNIIQIDEEKCTGCGQCILDCAEGALQLVDGKARLMGEIYCDGLGACLGGCPTGALKVIQREAEDFDEQAVEEILKARQGEPPQAAATLQAPAPRPHAGGCPSLAAMTLQPAGTAPDVGQAASQLGHWPIKLQLLNPQAPFLKGADLLLLADCAAASLPDLHARLLGGRAIALACPKLDDAQAHINKLAQVLAQGQPRSLTVVHMEVPCCKGLEFIAQKALAQAGLEAPLGSMMVARDGRVLEQALPWRATA